MKSYEELLMENNILKLQIKDLEDKLKVKITRNAGRKGLNSEDINKIHNLNNLNYKPVEISDILNLSLGTVYKYLKEDTSKKDNLKDDKKLLDMILKYMFIDINRQVKKGGKIPKSFCDLKEYYKEIENLEYIVDKISILYNNNLEEFLQENKIILDLPLSYFFSVKGFSK